ncbi:beta-1,3-galactosyltransferase 1 isoform X2 [Aquila chrysaetos chrysaetos]|uniref:beta-1,3-galactosyltransferase 1 isoform X2 n=1 Tax=Aquila chrysaetos chrysaetos TaxID=223781 RepID=UPI0005D0D42D|nr:beta-1,3-galactosyltransferase 1 isoform X2 [Aquila chrysaetos chrysaetos]XP_029873330.1 beta-1,3-galactosyltransferase 1 isoform X2 [Aquila chrysaetos chrysaetos]
MGSQVHLELHKRISDVFTRSSHVVNPVLCFKKNYHLLAVEGCRRLGDGGRHVKEKLSNKRQRFINIQSTLVSYVTRKQANSGERQ